MGEKKMCIELYICEMQVGKKKKKRKGRAGQRAEQSRAEQSREKIKKLILTLLKMTHFGMSDTM